MKKEKHWVCDCEEGKILSMSIKKCDECGLRNNLQIDFDDKTNMFWLRYEQLVNVKKIAEMYRVTRAMVYKSIKEFKNANIK